MAGKSHRHRSSTEVIQWPCRASRETQGRGDKAVTLLRGLALNAAALAETGKRLRSACVAGGTLKDGVLEVQADPVERAIEWLRAQGLAAMRAGG